ncbi:MAG: hypothetical protein IKU33_05240, partial [Bacteroidales bacterium]|nr:hypothetical protein [Bacteroidales bacterium]
MFAFRSIPADFSVAYAGVGYADLFTICTFIIIVIGLTTANLAFNSEMKECRPAKERHGPETVPPKYSTTYEQTETSPCLSTRFPFILLIN